MQSQRAPRQPLLHKTHAQQTLSARVSCTVSLALALACIGCTKPRQTTAVGSGVGGAVGAGLGAIIGNQSGNAGGGLAIGAGAGAAVGALIGNALQAQEERSQSQDEAIKRQERVIQAQRSELNDLRTIRGDDSYSLNSAAQQSPRYRYRGTPTDSESPEVARQRAKLQQRGPLPRNSSGSIYSKSYYSYTSPSARVTAAPPVIAAPLSKPSPRTPSVSAATAPAPAPARAPVAALPSDDGQKTQPLARYDLRADLATTGSSAAPAEKHSASLPKARESATKQEISESDLVVPALAAAAATSSSKDTPPAKAASPKSPAALQSKECKEAFSERDLAMEATDNSDKLFHLRRALRLCPQSAPLHHELGKVYASMQRPKDAEDEFKQALSIDPSLSAAKRELGSLLKDEVQF